MHKDNPFDSTYTIKSIYTPDDAVAYRTVDGVLFSKDLKMLISYPRSKKGFRYAIPSDVDTLLHGAFNNPLFLHSVIFPKPNITIIGYNFNNMRSSLKHVYVIRDITDNTNLTLSTATFLREYSNRLVMLQLKLGTISASKIQTEYHTLSKIYVTLCFN